MASKILRYRGPGGPIALRRYAPMQPLIEPPPARVYFHGGGLVVGTCHAGMIHLFYALSGLIPYASTAMRLIGAQIAGALC